MFVNSLEDRPLELLKIIKKSVILVWFINMNILCNHVHRLERADFLFRTCMSKIRNPESTTLITEIETIGVQVHRQK